MCEANRTVTMGFGGERFAPGVHICLVYRDEFERKRIVGKFVGSGLSEHEQVLYFADTSDTNDVHEWLASLDIEVDGQFSDNELSVRPAMNAYCPDGTFSPPRMLSTLEQAYNTSVQQGFPGSRVTGEMSWALTGVPGSERLMEYEAGINDVVQTHPISAMCQYDANRFDGETIFRALQVHPYLVMNGQLVKNPYFISAGG